MRIETVGLHTIDGLHLEGDLALTPDPAGAAVVAHPHPQYGGDRFNPVVDALFGALAGAGWTVVRFDFRGVGASEGRHGGGADERMDVVAGIDLVTTVAPDAPIWLLGYSFGATVTLDVTDPRVAGWVGVAPPLAALPRPCLAGPDHRPKLLLVPEHDQLSPPSATVGLTADWSTTTVETIPMGDHFLAGRTAWVAEHVIGWLAGR